MDKWELLRRFIKLELVEAQNNYESTIERQLERILKHMTLLEDQRFGKERITIDLWREQDRTIFQQVPPHPQG
ncbi:hypothetical protein [Paenibacillus ehimensis]|uniref:hypothetical protein n=1 Tax=Paenibacillus ehimensis TaxID=79264 RepID=UPI000FD99225|nr:hypothetical protein [Paenibacillus ehimensis]